MVQLEEKDYDALWYALAAAKLYYQQQGAEQRLRDLEELFRIITHGKVYVELDPVGREEYRKIMQKREEQKKEGGRLISFPGQQSPDPEEE